LALALDSILEVTLSLEGEGLEVEVEGEGANLLPRGEDNLIVRAVRRLFGTAGFDPRGLRLRCLSAIPIASGLGSSAAAVIAGLTAANSLLGGKLTPQEILAHAADLEGHADNAAAALIGGLAVVTSHAGRWTARRLPIAEMKVAVAIPNVPVTTADMRRLLPAQVPLADATSNLAHLALALEGFRLGDYDLLAVALHDRLHEPYRTRHIPGFEQVRRAGLAAGAAAVVLAGAGPSLLAFAPGRHEEIAEAMASAFRDSSISSRAAVYSIAKQGATSLPAPFPYPR
ncbi:MAG: homoserine kinase, partial [Anaerolineales bacterium]